MEKSLKEVKLQCEDTVIFSEEHLKIALGEQDTELKEQVHISV